MTEIHARNNDQAAAWNGTAGQAWVNQHAALDALQAPIAAELFQAIDLASGSRVLDIGCGSGETTFALARRVGADGQVTGLDISAPLLALARQRVPADLPVKFVEADATVHPFEPGAADLLFSRNGVMFFADPAQSFTNMRKGLRSGATVTFACWREVKRNPWAVVPLQAAQKALPAQPPAAPPDPEAPGPYSFASAQRVERILNEAGFVEISLRPLEIELDISAGNGVEGAVKLMQLVGPVSRLLANQPETVRTAAADFIREAMTPYAKGGAVLMEASIWIAAARNP
jgi:SAM-dependent methyltransferase